ncbi:MAG TPA: imidazole glycerol phosphate synthase subunit HisF [Planctomycetes bacterium]|nr:imidazole glycerol phosphate synthase subunit HisF [Planctomycetota bacterium]
MDYVRVIPCLDIKDGRVVKGVKFVNLRDASDPVEAAAAYSEQGADEIVFLDIAATVENRRTRLDWVKRVAEAVTVPFAVGGGISSLDDMEELFAIGADKVSVNSAAVRNPRLVKEAAGKFGGRMIVVAIDGQSLDGRYEVLVNGGNGRTGLDAVEWAGEVERAGAGEILLTSRDADGTEAGYDIPMTRAVADAVSIPVTASGGCGELDHFVRAVKDAKASAVLAASVFHFGKFTVRQVKRHLQEHGVPVKP